MIKSERHLCHIAAKQKNPLAVFFTTTCCEALSDTSVQLLQYSRAKMVNAASQAMLQYPWQKPSKQYKSS